MLASRLVRPRAAAAAAASSSSSSSRHRLLLSSASPLRPPPSLLQRSFSSSTSSPDHPPQPPHVFRLALVGRPNVGKSTLFNRLTGNAHGQWTGGSALVTPIPGTTRDRKTGGCAFGGYSMLVTDTGGLVEDTEEREDDEEDEELEEVDADDPRGKKQQRARAERKRMQDLINGQVAQAVQESDAVLFVLDARGGVGPEEAHVARWLHKVGAQDKTLLVANKAEGGVLSVTMQAAIADAYAFGLGDPVAISAAHNEGISDLASVLVERAAALGCARTEEEEEGGEEEKEKEDVITVAFVGLPNVGKSSLVNATLNKRPRQLQQQGGEQQEEGQALDSSPRLITSEVAGTTRDVVLVDYAYQGRRLRLVDTAGIRRKGRQDHSNHLEQLSVDEALRALRYANIVVLVLDGQQLRLRRQEQVVASRAFEEGRALVVAANKSDLLLTSPKLFAENVREQLKLLSPQLGSLPVVATSALHGQGVGGLLPAVLRAYQAWNTRVSTGLLNRWLVETQRMRSPPLTTQTRKPVKLKYITQIKTRPPTFALVTNRGDVEESYVRFLRNRLQEDFGLHGMDVRLNIRSTSASNPYAAKAAAEAAERKRALLNKQKKKREGEGGGKGETKDDQEEREEEERKRRRQARDVIKRKKLDEQKKRRAYRTRTVGSAF